MSTDDNNIGYAWNFVADLGNGRQLSVAGNFPKGATAAEMNKEIDKLRSVLDRQQAKSAAMAAEQEVEQYELRLKNMKEDFARIEKENGAKNGLTVAERTQRTTAMANIERMQQDIDYKKGVLAKLQKEAA